MRSRTPREQPVNWFYWLLALVPVALVAEFLHAPPLAVFIISGLAIIPLSALLGRATEELAGHVGPALGGLLNATLGNLAELIIGAIALRAGLIDLVKASITGSILGNLLLVLGAALLAGGLRYKALKFSPHLAGVNVALLVIAVVGLVVPALFHASHPEPGRIQSVHVSEAIAVLLIIGYALSLLYSLGTHRAVLSEGGDVAAGDETPAWSLSRALIALVVVAAAIGYMSELLVGTVEVAANALGLSEFFVGLILVPIIGNAAEHSTAILMARKNRMDLAIGIAIGSSVQVSLLIAPILVFLGALFGQPMDLAFQTFEVASVVLAVWIASVIVFDAESNWLEGAFLLIVYGVLGVAFFFF